MAAVGIHRRKGVAREPFGDLLACRGTLSISIFPCRIVRVREGTCQGKRVRGGVRDNVWDGNDVLPVVGEQPRAGALQCHGALRGLKIWRGRLRG